MSQKKGRANEKQVQEWLEGQGYEVINVNDKGFPDLLIMNNGKIEFMAEVKGGRHQVHIHQKEFQNKLEKIFRIPIKNYRIINQQIVEE